jgi:hypothetical protein
MAHCRHDGCNRESDSRDGYCSDNCKNQPQGPRCTCGHAQCGD